MAQRITHVRKDSQGGITEVANLSTGFRETAASAVYLIDVQHVRLYVNEAGYESDVHTVNGRYLRTYADATSKNNLDNLPRF